ncbi:MAG: glycosyltransferase family 2 protein [Thalassobaculum sp.]|uniref:glycosyltransferase family 2 protein n=1 Tax=Thalassobaculum sp. TaxID=2022740 RepID=UPI0032EF8997
MRTNSGSLGTCSVVIVSYRTGPVLIDSLRAALDQEAVDAVVLVDNGNSAETRRAVDGLAAADKRLRILRGHGNVGFARGCNLGVAAATGSHLLLLNPDCMLRPGVVARGLQVMADNPGTGALTVRVENTDGTEQRGGRRNLMTPWTCLVEQFRLDRLMPNHPHFQRLNLNEAEPLTEITPVQCISGAFMLMPRTVYERVGGMDEDYFLHVEDVDLCLRIQKAGSSILYVPDAAVTHVKGTSRVFPLVVEWHKSVSVAKYFGKHFRPQYPDLALRLISLAIFMRLAVRAVPLTLGWLLERLGLKAAKEE